MTYLASSALDFLDEEEEEKIIREYEQECANEDVLDIRKLNLNGEALKSESNNNKIDKCLNISDDEYLKNLNELDNDSKDGSIDNKSVNNRSPLYLNTSIPLFALDNLNNLNKVARRKLKEFDKQNLDVCVDPLDFNQLDNRLADLTNFTSTLNQLNDQSNGLNASSSNSDISNSLLNNSSNNISNFSNNLSSTSINSSNDNLLNTSSSVNLKRKKSKTIVTFEIISAKSVLSGMTNSSRRFVVYTIIIKRTPGLETKPGIIEKR